MRRLLVLLIPVTMLTSGCVTNLTRFQLDDDDHVAEALGIYPTTKMDLVMVTSPVSVPVIAATTDYWDDGAEAVVWTMLFFPVFMTVGAVDLPFALATDTFYLPSDLKHVRERKRRESQQVSRGVYTSGDAVFSVPIPNIKDQVFDSDSYVGFLGAGLTDTMIYYDRIAERQVVMTELGEVGREEGLRMLAQGFYEHCPVSDFERIEWRHAEFWNELEGGAYFVVFRAGPIESGAMTELGLATFIHGEYLYQVVVMLNDSYLTHVQETTENQNREYLKTNLLETVKSMQYFD